MAEVNGAQYLQFPFAVTDEGPVHDSRTGHIRGQIEQVLFTNPRERVFRPEFGVGVRRLVFEPNNLILRNTVVKRLNYSLARALYGEVDPRTLKVEVKNEAETLSIHISYTLAALNKAEAYTFRVGPAGGSNG